MISRPMIYNLKPLHLAVSLNRPATDLPSRMGSVLDAVNGPLLYADLQTS